MKIRYLIVALTFTLALLPLHPALALSIGSGTWTEMRPISLYYLADPCSVRARGNGDCSRPLVCVQLYADAFDKSLLFNGDGWIYHRNVNTRFYMDNRCQIDLGTSLPFPPFTKPVTCPVNQVVTGVRDYEWFAEVDEEHIDADCAPVSGATVDILGSWWSSPPNASATSYGGYKTATCAAGQVMTGVSMIGLYSDVDEEHIDARCSNFSGIINTSTAHWVTAPNAWDILWGGYKTTQCGIREAAIGVRYYSDYPAVDSEHTDVLCARVGALPTVNIHFI